MQVKDLWIVDSWPVTLRLTVGSDPWSLKDFEPHSLYSSEYDLCKCSFKCLHRCLYKIMCFYVCNIVVCPHCAYVLHRSYSVVLFVVSLKKLCLFVFHAWHFLFLLYSYTTIFLSQLSPWTQPYVSHRPICMYET